jgi:cytochrome bd-type quinol oxidase subunit 2
MVRHFGDRGLFVVAALATLAASAVLLVVPVYSSGQTLLEANGPEVLWVILLPLVLAALPLAAPRTGRRRLGYVVGAALLVLSFISSAGIFFLLPAILLIVAARAAPSYPEP